MKIVRSFTAILILSVTATSAVAGELIYRYHLNVDVSSLGGGTGGGGSDTTAGGGTGETSGGSDPTNDTGEDPSAGGLSISLAASRALNSVEWGDGYYINHGGQLILTTTNAEACWKTQAGTTDAINVNGYVDVIRFFGFGSDGNPKVSGPVTIRCEDAGGDSVELVFTGYARDIGVVVPSDSTVAAGESVQLQWYFDKETPVLALNSPVPATNCAIYSKPYGEDVPYVHLADLDCSQESGALTAGPIQEDTRFLFKWENLGFEWTAKDTVFVGS